MKTYAYKFNDFLQFLCELKNEEIRYSSVRYTLFQDSKYQITYSWCGDWWNYYVYKYHTRHTFWLKRPYKERELLITFAPSTSNCPERFSKDDVTLWQIATAEAYIKAVCMQNSLDIHDMEKDLLADIIIIRDAIKEVN